MSLWDHNYRSAVCAQFAGIHCRVDGNGASADITPSEIVQSLARNRVGSVPVIDDDRKVVGVVSESDLLTHLVIGRPSPVAAAHRIGAGRDRRRKDDSIRTHILDGIVVGQMAIDPRALTVTVEEGDDTPMPYPPLY